MLRREHRTHMTRDRNYLMYDKGKWRKGSKKGKKKRKKQESCIPVSPIKMRESMCVRAFRCVWSSEILFWSVSRAQAKQVAFLCPVPFLRRGGGGGKVPFLSLKCHLEFQNTLPSCPTHAALTDSLRARPAVRPHPTHSSSFLRVMKERSGEERDGRIIKQKPYCGFPHARKFRRFFFVFF